MSTGIETWNMNLLDIGPMYPFPGIEGLLVVIGVASWIIWHLIQLRLENKIYEEDEAKYATPDKVLAAMEASNAETLLEAMKAHGEKLK